MLRCWTTEGEERPTMDEIVSELVSYERSRSFRALKSSDLVSRLLLVGAIAVAVWAYIVFKLVF